MVVEAADDLLLAFEFEDDSAAVLDVEVFEFIADFTLTFAAAFVDKEPDRERDDDFLLSSSADSALVAFEPDLEREDDFLASVVLLSSLDVLDALAAVELLLENELLFLTVLPVFSVSTRRLLLAVFFTAWLD